MVERRWRVKTTFLEREFEEREEKFEMRREKGHRANKMPSCNQLPNSGNQLQLPRSW